MTKILPRLSVPGLSRWILLAVLCLVPAAAWAQRKGVKGVPLPDAKFRGAGRARAGLAPPPPPAFNGPRFQGRWVDGSLTSTNDLSAWNAPDAQPQLGGQRLLDPGHPLRWLRDRAVTSQAPPDAFVEFVGGDCLPGSVTAYAAASELPGEPEPACLVVSRSVRLEPAGLPAQDSVRVLPAAVARIVWQRTGEVNLHPNTVFMRSGRETSFRSLRWEADSIKLLTADGLLAVPFSEIAELHLPKQDSWAAHCKRLAVLAPDLKGRLLQIEASDGLVATGSLARFQARSAARGSDPTDSVHVIQPAWSLDALFVPYRTIRQWTFFDPLELPLVWIEPAVSSHRGIFSNAWSRFRVNANVQDGLLVSGGEPAGWGLGVHAEHVLEYALPKCATGFRTRIGLDQAVADGGCARARIYGGPAAQQQLFESPVLIGSAKGVDSGPLSLPEGGQQPTRLRLVADALWTDRPAGADPLDIRDALDWLEPLVSLAAEPLKGDLAPHAETALPGLAGWKIEGTAGSDWELTPVTRMQERPLPRFRLAIHPQRDAVKLTRAIEVRQDAATLMVLAARSSDRSGAVRFEARVNGQLVGSTALPDRHGDGSLRPIAIELQELVGRKADVELTFLPASNDAAIEWQAAGMVDKVPGEKKKK